MNVVDNNGLPPRKIVDCKELALKKVVFSGDIVGRFGTFEIEQTYLNNTLDVLEVIYTFPIVETAAVTGFMVTASDRVLYGICKEKEKALKEYTEKIVAGDSAYMMNQDTDNIFSVSLGKIDINEEIKIKITYIDILQVVDNEIKLLIPTFVAPRYKSEITDALEYGPVEYTADFSINVDKSVNVEEITSVTHEIEIKDLNDKFEVKSLNYDMSSDFTLNIKLKKELNSNAVTTKTKYGNDIVSLSFMPEIEGEFDNSPKEYIFIVDISGSMGGRKLEETKNALKECLRHLDDGDSFNIIPFQSKYFAFEIESVKFNEENLKRAETYIDSLVARGGTEILAPVKFALYEQSDDKVILLFTDGEVGNETEIIKFVSDNIRESKLFAFGIDTSINTTFIRNLSKAGNGKAEFIHPGEKIDDKIIRTFARIQSPLVQKLTIDYGKNYVVDEIKEENTLFNYEFFNVITKLERLEDDISLRCKVSGKDYEWKIYKEDIADAGVNLEKILAQLHINRLEQYLNAMPFDRRSAYKKMIVDISVKENIVTKYTTFITVYEREDKLFEVPKVQNIVLSDENYADIKSCRTISYELDVPTFMMNQPKTKTRMDDEVDNVEATTQENKFELPRINNNEDELIKYFNENKITSLKTYLLYAIYFYNNYIYDIITEEELKEFLVENLEAIRVDDELLDLVYIICKFVHEEIEYYIYGSVFTSKYKKIMATEFEYDIDTGCALLKENQIVENIRKDIDRVLWSMIIGFDDQNA